MKKLSLITKKFVDSFRSRVGTDLRICFRQPRLLHRCQFLVCAGILALIPSGFAADIPSVPAFPGAEGYGAMTRGGRGGKVIMVTNLNDTGPGSLRDACETEGPRIVVFAVSGTITLESRLRISNPYITIAGQTAPGEGICIKKYPLSINASEVIIRYIRVRLGDETGDDTDAISGKHKYPKNIILDHVSASWSVDETVSIYHCENVTVQWCLVSESMYNAGHAKGTHGFGGIWGSNRSTYHHNLLAHHSSRNPRFASGCGYNDFRNNTDRDNSQRSAVSNPQSLIGRA
jgi:pectate lyase